MNDNRSADYSPVLARLTTTALVIVLGVGLAAIAGGYMIIQSELYPPVENSLVRNILFIAGIIDLGVVQFLKKTLLFKARLSSEESGQNYRAILPVTLVIAGMCSAISIYGLAAVLVGSSLEVLLFFVAVSLIGFQLFRIRAKDLEKRH